MKCGRLMACHVCSTGIIDSNLVGVPYYVRLGKYWNGEDNIPDLVYFIPIIIVTARQSTDCCSISLLPCVVRYNHQGYRNILACHFSLSAPRSQNCSVVMTWSWLGSSCVFLPGLFRQFFTIARTRETLWYLIYPSPLHSL